MAKKCEFNEDEKNERLIELIIASTPITELQKELLNKTKGFTLQAAIKLGRTYEATAVHLHDLQQMHESTLIILTASTA